MGLALHGKAPGAPGKKGRARLLSRGAVGLASAVVLIFLWALFGKGRSDRAPEEALPLRPTPAPWTLDLTGRWQGQVSKLLSGPPPRPALKEVSLETDREGDIYAASVVLTDPGRGGAGAGYRIVPDGGRKLQQILAALSASPVGAALPIDFIAYAPWIPKRDRIWRPLEGHKGQPEEVQYLLLESVEDDYLVQAGVNQTGFLSYAFFSPSYASGRGIDVLSRVIHPGPGSSLGGFENLIWDLSGAADFVNLQVIVTVSGPDGQADKLTLKR